MIVELYGNRFSWDEKKQAANIKKHDITFLEAASVFNDEYSLLKYDPDHSEEEDRYIVLGYSDLSKLLMVCHCYREDDVIRIISARKADKLEGRDYESKRR